MSAVTYIAFICLFALSLLIGFMMLNLLQLQKQEKLLKSDENKV